MSTSLRITADEYDRMIAKGAFEGMDRRIELIQGELRQVSPAGPVHEDCVDFLTRWSTSVTSPADCVVRIQSSIDLGDSRPEPDVAWLRSGRYASRRPKAGDVLLLIEVAESSLGSDTGEKAELYAEAGISEYWVVDCAAKSVHVFTSPQGKQYLNHCVVTADEAVSPSCKPDAKLFLAELFI